MGCKVPKQLKISQRLCWADQAQPSMPAANLCRGVIHIHGRIHLTFYDEEEAVKVAQHETSNYVVIPPSSIDTRELLPSLTQIFRFDEMARITARRNPTQKLIFSAGSDLMIRLHSAFLLGCHAMISHDVDFEGVYPALHRMHDVFESARSDDHKMSVYNGLRAVCQARKHGWIDFKETFDTGSLNSSSIAMDEYLHYAR